MKQRSFSSSDTVRIPFPSDFNFLMTRARRSFQGQLNVNALYNEFGERLSTLDELVPGQTIYVSDFNPEETYRSPVKSPRKQVLAPVQNKESLALLTGSGEVTISIEEPLTLPKEEDLQPVVRTPFVKGNRTRPQQQLSNEPNLPQSKPKDLACGITAEPASPPDDASSTSSHRRRRKKHSNQSEASDLQPDQVVTAAPNPTEPQPRRKRRTSSTASERSHRSMTLDQPIQPIIVDNDEPSTPEIRPIEDYQPDEDTSSQSSRRRRRKKPTTEEPVEESNTLLVPDDTSSDSSRKRRRRTQQQSEEIVENYSQASLPPPEDASSCSTSSRRRRRRHQETEQEPGPEQADIPEPVPIEPEQVGIPDKPARRKRKKHHLDTPQVHSITEAQEEIGQFNSQNDQA